MKTLKAIPFITDFDKKHIRKDIEDNPEYFVKELLTGSNFNFGVYEVINIGIYREMGFNYPLRSFLTKYLYKQYNSWHEIYALNRTNVRKLIVGKIDKIIELK